MSGIGGYPLAGAGWPGFSEPPDPVGGFRICGIDVRPSLSGSVGSASVLVAYTDVTVALSGRAGLGAQLDGTLATAPSAVSCA